MTLNKVTPEPHALKQATRRIITQWLLQNRCSHILFAKFLNNEVTHPEKLARSLIVIIISLCFRFVLPPFLCLTSHSFLPGLWADCH